MIGKYIGNQLNMPGVCRCGTISAITASAATQVKVNLQSSVRKAATSVCYRAMLIYSTEHFRSISAESINRVHSASELIIQEYFSVQPGVQLTTENSTWFIGQLMT